MSYQSKDILIHGRQLAAQSCVAVVNAVAGTSDLAGRVTVDNSTIGATVVTFDLGEPIEKCFLADVRVQATGAILAIAAAPSIAVANKISVTFDGTAQTAVCVTLTYKILE